MEKDKEKVTPEQAAEETVQQPEKKPTEQPEENPVQQPEEKPAEQPEKAEEPKAKEKSAKKSSRKKNSEELEKAQAALAAEHEQYLRLAAEYDNYRKRSQREKDAIYTDAVADTVKKLLPVYDNLERALQNKTEDAAYKKGVEMIMTELVKIFAGLKVEASGEAGETFDPQLHNAVMHTEDESLGENTVAEVFQKGFKLGDKVIRFAMVRVAN